MSTSATQSGTTTRAGRSGKGLGIAAAALAIVLAGGFVFAINQGTDQVTVSAAERATQIASERWDEMIAMNEAAYLQHSLQGVGNAEIERLNEMAAAVQSANSLESTTPSYVRELNELASAAEQARLESHPAFNIEKTKMELAGQLTTKSPGSNPELYKLTHSIQLGAHEPTELNQPEWDNRMP